jgi:hypothetical protein
LKRAAALIAIACASGTAHATPLVAVPSSDSHVELACEPGLEATARDLVRDASELASVAPEGYGAPTWAVGVAYPELGVVTIALRHGADLADPETTLRHELGHVALGVALGARAPRWLHEGFAAQHAREWNWDRMELLAGMAWFGGIVPFDELDAAFPALESAPTRAYAESYDFVGFLARRGSADDGSTAGDREPFRDFLHEVARGTARDRAAAKAFGRPLRALFDEWRSDLSRRYLFAPLGVLGLAVWISCAVLLWLAWRRRRRENRARIAQWDRDEGDIVAPPYVPWPGEDPLAHDPDETDRERDPRLMN